MFVGNIKYNMHSNWQILGQHSPIIPTGKLQASTPKQKSHNNKQLDINLECLVSTGKSQTSNVKVSDFPVKTLIILV